MWLGREGAKRLVERKWHGGSRGDGADVFVKDRCASVWILSVFVRENSDLSRRVTIATCRLAGCHAGVATLLWGRGNVVTGAWQRCYGGVATLLWGRGNVITGPWQRCYGAVATDELPCRNAHVPCENGFVPVGDGRKGLGLSGIGYFLRRALMLSVFFASHMRTEARWVAEKRCKGSVHEGVVGVGIARSADGGPHAAAAAMRCDMAAAVKRSGRCGGCAPEGVQLSAGCVRPDG